MKRKGKLNLAVIMMIFASVCLSTIQVGFSFIGQEVQMGGRATIVVQKQPESIGPALDLVTNSNAEFMQTITGAETGNGYQTIIKADDGVELNNYVKFGENATELWRIVGWTEYGIKVVKDTTLSTSSTSVWDTGNKFWVPVDGTSLPQAITVSSLSGSSSLCQYLNSTYYLTMTDPTNQNYINPDYINHTPVWNITPMYSSGSSNNPQYPTTNKSAVTCTAEMGAEGFYGLPFGILTVEEICMVASTFNFSNSNSTSYQYTTFTSSWLKVKEGETEITLSERHTSSNMSSLPSSISSIFTLTSTGVRYQNKSFSANYRPCCYLNSNVLLSANGNGTAGSSTNPFIVTGVNNA